MKKRVDFEGQFYNKRGQLTIFVVIALMIVVLGVLLYLFYPQVSSTLGSGTQDPNIFIQNCVVDEIENSIETVSIQGGNIEPSLYVLNNDEKISYLCYTQNYYQLCVVQQPLLKEHIESEIKSEIEETVNTCFDNLKSSFESKGYDVSITEGNIEVLILPGRVQTTMNYSVTLDRTETQKYNSFIVFADSNLYQFSEITNNIVDWESTYGDTEVTLYMDLNRDLKVEKIRPASEYGAKIYLLTNRNTGEIFQFATRSQVFPPGYGFADTN